MQKRLKKNQVNQVAKENIKATEHQVNVKKKLGFGLSRVFIVFSSLIFLPGRLLSTKCWFQSLSRSNFLYMRFFIACFQSFNKKFHLLVHLSS